MLNAKQQQGMTMIGWLTVFALIGFFSFLAIKLTPIVFEGISAKSAIKEIAKDPTKSTQSPREIRSSIAKRFDVSSVRNASAGKHVKIKLLQNGKRQVNLDYEVRTELFANISLIVSFSEEVELPPQASQ